MYSAISDEMLKFFAGAADFNSLIGEPVNRYRMNYKALEKLRQAFYLRVENVKEVEKYIDYYKWLTTLWEILSSNLFQHQQL